MGSIDTGTTVPDMENSVNKTIAAILAFFGPGEAPASAALELRRLQAFRGRQKQQARTRGTMRRSRELIDLEMGHTQRGTRAKSRGPYQQHLIENCAKMRARNVKRMPTYGKLSVTIDGQTFVELDSINYENGGHS